MIAHTFTATTRSLQNLLVHIEVDISKTGLPGFTLVGLADTAVKESKERIAAALRNCGYAHIRRRITINMAPANVRKNGSHYDLPIALGIIHAGISSFARKLTDCIIMGELALDGALRPVRGVLPALLSARRAGFATAIIPHGNRFEGSLVQDMHVYAFGHLRQVTAFLNNARDILPVQPLHLADLPTTRHTADDISDIKGQLMAKRALMIACAGRHNLLFYGPPGTGKSMLARRAASLLPHMNFAETLDTLSVYSIHQRLDENRIQNMLLRPFRAPHHTVTETGLIGGGTPPEPGEISLAHNGILFLDELPEFKQKVLNALRQPLEDHMVAIRRSKYAVTFPARFMLIAAMNPCPCGFYGSLRKECTCTMSQIRRYRTRLSGPLLDRIDLFVEVGELSDEEIVNKNAKGLTSQDMRRIVLAAYNAQRKRFRGTGFSFNADIPDKSLPSYCPVERAAADLLKSVIRQLGLSARAGVKLLKVARTIADFAGSAKLLAPHIAEASSFFRFLDY